jgi:hypothetical protein
MNWRGRGGGALAAGRGLLAMLQGRELDRWRWDRFAIGLGGEKEAVEHVGPDEVGWLGAAAVAAVELSAA